MKSYQIPINSRADAPFVTPPDIDPKHGADKAKYEAVNSVGHRKLLQDAISISQSITKESTSCKH